MTDFVSFAGASSVNQPAPRQPREPEPLAWTTKRQTPDRPLSPPEERPADAGLLPVAEPDAEVAVAYAAWRLDRGEAAR